MGIQSHSDNANCDLLVKAASYAIADERARAAIRDRDAETLGRWLLDRIEAERIHSGGSGR